MKFPERPTCHVIDPIFRYSERPIEWRDNGTCSYCGSLSPEKLLEVLADERSYLSGSDWKYGWPHKFYVTAPNPDADKIVEVGRTFGPGHPKEGTPSFGKKETLWFKWYNDHLKDDGFDDEAMNALLFALTTHSGIEWIKDEKGIHYRAPYIGYQRTGYDMRQLGPQEPGTTRAQT